MTNTQNSLLFQEIFFLNHQNNLKKVFFHIYGKDLLKHNQGPASKFFLNNLGNIYYKQKDYLKAIKIFEISYKIDNGQEQIGEKLANSLVQAKLRKEAETFLRDILKKFPNNSFLNTLMGNNLLALSCYKEGLDFLRKGTGFIELNNDSVNIV